MIWGPTRAKKTDFSHFIPETICKRIKTTKNFDYMQKERSYMQKKTFTKILYAKKILHFFGTYMQEKTFYMQKELIPIFFNFVVNSCAGGVG